MTMTTNTTAPAIIDTNGEAVNADEVCDFLDGVRDSGIINMFGAAPYVQEAFLVSARDARTLHGYWMDTFATRHPAA